MRAIGSPAWASQPQFATLYLRMQNREQLDALIGHWAATQDAEDAMARLQTAGVAAGVAANAEDACVRDPQLQARGFWPAVSLPKGEETRVCGFPFKLSATPVDVRRRAPIAGESNDYVFGELLGLSPAERQELIDRKILWP